MSAKRSAGPSVLITWHNELETWGPPIDLDALYPALRHLWDGTDRGELKALLVEAWGPSPKIAAERGRAKSMAAQQDEERLEAGLEPPCADPGCPWHEHDIP